MQLTSSHKLPNYVHLNQLQYISKKKPHSLSLNIGKSVLGDLDSIGVPGLALVGGGEAVRGRAAIQGESVTEVLVGSAEVDGDVVPAYLIPY